MKFSLLLFALSLPAHAELLATFHTDRGNVAVSLHFDKTPQTVANFITLAQATRSRIDPATGAVIRKPLYAGEKFYRVLNDPFFKIAQTGSGTGNNSGGPGYTFRDEFNPTLKHDPYVLAMANSGSAHDNGSQIYLTGSAAIPHLDNKHTVFGRINDPASKLVADSIMAGGDNGTTIVSVSFQRTSPAAAAFDEHGHKLPVCSGVAGALAVKPGVECAYVTDAFQPAGSVFQAFRSLNLQTWTKLGDIYQGAGMEGGVDRFILDSAPAPRAFYNISLVSYPDALAPASLANRILDLGLFGGQIIRFAFDGTGETGVFSYSADPSAHPDFEVFSYNATAHKAELIVFTEAYGYLKFDCMFDSENTTKVLGRNNSSQWNGFTFSTLSSGILELSKP
jgi:peptidyl-prolyl cis-trans isomerase A (cyclophilin A)